MSDDCLDAKNKHTMDATKPCLCGTGRYCHRHQTYGTTEGYFDNYAGTVKTRRRPLTPKYKGTRRYEV